MLELEVTYSQSGPLFDGRAAKALDESARDIEQRTAEFGASLIRSRMDMTFRHQTPFYRLQNQARRDGAHWKISDNGVIYGPWLEGVGSRNKTTRFKGYFNYRRSLAEIQRHMTEIGDGVVGAHLRAVGA
jgi:hypothetical protein